MLVDFKYNILKMQISDCMNSMENSVFQSSLSGFHSVKPGLTKNVLLMEWGVRRFSGYFYMWIVIN